MPASFDRLHDEEDNQPASCRELRPAPGLDQGTDTRGRAELAAENAGLGRAIRGLASENADLCKRLDALQAELKASQAKTKAEQDKFRTWAKEISNREAERAVRDEARNKREEALADRIIELERKDADKTAAVADSGSAERLIGGQEVARAETDQRKRPRNRPSNDGQGTGHLTRSSPPARRT